MLILSIDLKVEMIAGNSDTGEDEAGDGWFPGQLEPQDKTILKERKQREE